jgi:ribosomal protein L11 methyltransferase
MAYLALCFDVDAGAADGWGDALLAAGALSVDVADPHAGTDAETPLYAEPGEPAGALWPVSRITALFAADADWRQALFAAATAQGAPAPLYELRPVADADWVRATQAQFTPIRITDRLWIVPTWCEPVDPAAVNIALDPGLAFGTGSHPTTRLCLEWLSDHLCAGDAVLDYGCGSGILAIAAAKLGASRVDGVDIDAQAIMASRANAMANHVSASFVEASRFGAATAVGYDVVVANILANPLIVLAPLVASRVRPGGRVVLSGILGAQASAVIAAYREWFNIAVWKAGEDDWVALAGSRRTG